MTALIEGSLDKGDSMRVSRSRVHGERKGRIACNKYRLSAVAPLSFPFLHPLFSYGKGVVKCVPGKVYGPSFLKIADEAFEDFSEGSYLPTD